MKNIRVGSRESRLAVVQSEMVMDYIKENCPEYTPELVTMKTTGDRILDRNLDQIGGKGLFVKELDAALMDGRSDMSVHSLKDMPAQIPEELPLIGFSKREDPRDVLVLPEGVAELDFSKPVGCSSRRRMLQFQAMYPENCKKIYFMLGTNELGNVWEDFTKSYRVMMSETRRLFPDAIIYAIGVPYVEEAKVTTGDYINNANVDKMNNIILNICDEGGYYFLDVNEVLSDGNHSLISGASSDGVHMYEEYCKKMLDYLKTHYVSETSSSEAFSESSSETSSETESETSSETETAASN